MTVPPQHPAPANPGERRRPVVFLHTPKTGGSTFRSVLRQIYGDAFHYCEDPRIEQLQARLAEFACIELHNMRFRGARAWGHQELFRPENWAVAAGCDLFIMFRDPVDQVLSLYSQRQRALARLRAQGYAVPRTLREYLDAAPDAFDMQLAFLLAEDRLRSTTVRRADDLERGKRMLEELRIKIGIMERFPESMALFEAVTGCTIPLETVKIENRTTHPPWVDEVDDELRRTISERSTLDRALYEFATTRFDEQLATFGVERSHRFRFV